MGNKEKEHFDLISYPLEESNNLFWSHIIACAWDTEMVPPMRRI